MFSRSTCIENLYLADDVNLDKMLCDKEALEEKIRIDEASLSTTTIQEFDLFYINIRSFHKHKEDLLCDIYAKKSKSICLTQTCLEDNEASQEYAGMKVFTASRGNGKGCIATVSPDSNLIAAKSEESFQLLSYKIRLLLQKSVTK